MEQLYKEIVKEFLQKTTNKTKNKMVSRERAIMIACEKQVKSRLPRMTQEIHTARPVEKK